MGGERKKALPTASFQCVRSRRNRARPASSWSYRETNWTTPLRRDEGQQKRKYSREEKVRQAEACWDWLDDLPPPTPTPPQ